MALGPCQKGLNSIGIYRLTDSVSHRRLFNPPDAPFYSHSTTMSSSALVPVRNKNEPDEADQNEAALQDFIQLLEDHKKSCEAAGKYMEADVAKKRLEELRRHEEERRDENLRSRQVAQRLGIEEAHMLEFQQFNEMWDRTMHEYEERARELLEAMRQRHELDFTELREKGAGSGVNIKASAKLLDLRRIEQTLAKQGEYTEAHKVKLRADRMEYAERERALGEKEQQLIKAEQATLHRQDHEVRARAMDTHTRASQSLFSFSLSLGDIY